MIYIVTENFTELEKKEGLIENVGEVDIEVCITDKEPVIGSPDNVILSKHNKLPFTTENTSKKIYLRTLTYKNGKIDYLEVDVNGSDLGLGDIYTKKQIDTMLNKKVNIVQGKTLSSNDFTDTLKEKLEGIDLTQYQGKTDLTLKTTSKTISGAINEIFDMIKALEVPTA